MPTFSDEIPNTGVQRIDDLVAVLSAHGMVMSMQPRFGGPGWQFDVVLYASDVRDIDTESKARRWLAEKALAMFDAIEVGGWQLDSEAGFEVLVDSARPPYGPRHPGWERRWTGKVRVLLAE
jgi:hypothetical protein